MRLPHRITGDELVARRWELLALTSVGAFMSPLDSSIVAVALPVMGPDLRLTFSAGLWVQAIYLLTMAVLLIPLGRLADHHGRVRFYLAGIGVFTLGSVLAALSMSGPFLIGARVVQGAGAALLSATSAAIVTAVFPPSERGRALGINVMAVYIGLSVGPPLGGFIVDHFSWRWIFLINLPIGILVGAWGALLLPRHERGNERAPRIDVAGGLLLATFLTTLLVPLTFTPFWGWDSARTIGLLVVAAASLVAFVIAERRVRDPMLDMRLLTHNRLFAAANSAALLNYMAMYAISVLTATFLEKVQDLSAGVTGWLMLGAPVMQAALSPFTGRLSDRVGSRVLTVSGMVAIAAGMVSLAALSSGSAMAQVVVSLAVVGIGLALFSAPNTSAIMGSVRRDQLSLASAFLSTMRATGMALSIAVLGGIAASHLGPEGGRVLFGHGRGGGPADVAIDAYAQGYRAAMLAGAGLALVGAAVSLVRGAPGGDTAAPEPATPH